jgi:predicted enzyme related to lactoylglutathione lyase
MSTRTTPWDPGTPCWTDLASPDAPASNAFYQALFGWEVRDSGEEMGHYGICLVKGLPVAGIGPKPPGVEMPAAWTTYLASEDVDKTAELVTAAGGAVLMPVMDVADQGRMFVAQDPTGAVFGVWQAVRMIGAQVVNEPGGVVWNDCNTRDVAAAKAFYSAVFGYTWTRMEGDDEYWTIDGAGPGSTIGGLCPINPALPADVPSHWMTYFVVTDADAAAATAAGQGGTVRVPPFDSPVGRMCVISDPHGAVFTVSQDTQGMFPGD